MLLHKVKHIFYVLYKLEQMYLKFKKKVKFYNIHPFLLLPFEKKVIFCKESAYKRDFLSECKEKL